MTRQLEIVLMALAGVAASCGTPAPPAPYEPPAGFVTDQHIVYTDGLHNENTEMMALDDRIILIFRGGETAQIGSDRAHINVYASKDQGVTFDKQSEVSAVSLPGMRDIRDPKLVQMNDKLYLYAISRLPGGHYRDLLGQAWTVRSESTDKGLTWTDPVKTFTDVDGTGNETFWGFWRFTKRSFSEGGTTKQTLYALGYDDDDVDVGLFASDDGINWTKRSIVVSSYEDVPSEAELQFFGDNQSTAVAIVRMDNQGILQDGQSAICTSHEPFTSWECGRRIEQRLDGPTWISQEINGVRRNFVVARKHLPCTYKRTAVYELVGDLTDPSAPIKVCEIEELKSAGDTAYTALAPLADQTYLMSWYSSTLPETHDIAWLAGTYSPSDIWLAHLDLSKATGACHAPPAKEVCKTAPLPIGSGDDGTSGKYLFTVAPVIYPAQTLQFEAQVSIHSQKIDLTLQPLDPMTHLPTGTSWETESGTVDDHGIFSVSFSSEFPPEAAFPLLADPFLELKHLVFRGALNDKGTFCGVLTGTAQVLGVSPADAIDLAGTTFGAVPIKGATLPEPLVACRGL